MRILITGIAGGGKTSIVRALQEQGHQSFDLDDSGICAWVHRENGTTAKYVEGAGKEWIAAHRWQVIESRLIEQLESFNSHKNIYVGGKVASNQVEAMAKMFDRIYLLQPDDSVIDERLASRTSNTSNFGKKSEERQHLIENRRGFEETYLAVGAIPIKNHGSIGEVLELILTDY